MRIATFNINDIRRRLPVLLAWLEVTRPDIVCLQELKCTDQQFPAEALAAAGFGAAWVGQASWNGVAILARGTEPIVSRRTLPGDAGDAQARYLEAAVNGMLVASLYAPNGNPRPGPKFDYKLGWTDRLVQHARELLATGLPVVLAGDFNIVPEPRDIYETRSYDDNALVQPESRQRYAQLLEQGWTDALRRIMPDETVYTFWDYGGTAGRATPGCGSTTCCCRMSWSAACKVPASIVTFAACPMPATMRPPGSSSTSHQQQMDPDLEPALFGARELDRARR